MLLVSTCFDVGFFSFVRTMLCLLVAVSLKQRNGLWCISLHGNHDQYY